MICESIINVTSTKITTPRNLEEINVLGSWELIYNEKSVYSSIVFVLIGG